MGATKSEPSADRKARFQLVVPAADEINDADLPEPEALVPPILYPGLTLLASRAKVGKKLARPRSLFGRVFAAAKGGQYVSLEERPRQT